MLLSRRTAANFQEIDRLNYICVIYRLRMKGEYEKTTGLTKIYK